MRKLSWPAAAVLAVAVIAALPARADWRDDIKVLRIGTVAPRGAAYDIPGWSRFAPICRIALACRS